MPSLGLASQVLAERDALYQRLLTGRLELVHFLGHETSAFVEFQLPVDVPDHPQFGSRQAQVPVQVRIARDLSQTDVGTSPIAHAVHIEQHFTRGHVRLVVNHDITWLDLGHLTSFIRRGVFKALTPFIIKYN